MLKTNDMFCYSWHIDPNEPNVTAIRVYGLDRNNENICVRINNFTPYAYLELPEHLKWDDSSVYLLTKKICGIMGEQSPLKTILTHRYKLYYVQQDKYGKRKKFPYLFCSFSSINDRYDFSKKLRRSVSILGMGTFRLKNTRT